MDKPKSKIKELPHGWTKEYLEGLKKDREQDPQRFGPKLKPPGVPSDYEKDRLHVECRERVIRKIEHSKAGYSQSIKRGFDRSR